MTYDGPSLTEWLAEYRSRRPPTEVVMYRTRLVAPASGHPARKPVVSLVVSRFEDPDNPRPDRGIYLFSLDHDNQGIEDTWHESVEDAFDQAESQFGIARSQRTAVHGA